MFARNPTYQTTALDLTLSSSSTDVDLNLSSSSTDVDDDQRRERIFQPLRCSTTPDPEARMRSSLLLYPLYPSLVSYPLLPSLRLSPDMLTHCDSSELISPRSSFADAEDTARSSLSNTRDDKRKNRTVMVVKDDAYKERRQKNNEAARKSREKKKQNEQRNRALLRTQEERNKTLTADCNRQKEKYETLMAEYNRLLVDFVQCRDENEYFRSMYPVRPHN